MSRLGRGFTLIEVLLALVLLAAGLALAFAMLRSAGAIGARGEAMAAGNETQRTTEGFLRQRLASALPLVYAHDAGMGKVLRFSGDAQQMSFVADLPDYLGRGGPHLHRVVFTGDHRLVVSFSLVQAGQVFEERPQRPPELLAEGLRMLRFRYRGPDAEGRLGPWQDAWTARDRLPLLVAMQAQDAQGRDWPEMVVALPRGSVQPVSPGLPSVGASP
ncbi:MAG: prepilin-type N-terminal cleavage/methylation domain-containing protein [Pseudoxanthomonas sp.]